MRVLRSMLPVGDAGARSTVRRMVQLARRASSHPTTRAVATQIVSPYTGRDYDLHALAIRDWASRHVQFLRDPRGTELLHDPVLLLQMIAAARNGVAHVDCDDAAMVTAALGLSIGLKARYVTLSFLDKRAPFAHIFTQLSSPVGSPRWIEQDTTRSMQDIPLNAIARSYIVEL